MSRGGARVGAGRKGLTATEKLLIGGECDRRWQELAEREAMERYEADAKTKEIRLEQSRTELIPKHARKHAGEALEDIADDIDDITGGNRLRSIEIRRPYGSKPAIIADVIEYVRDTYGKSVTAGQIAESWKLWSKFKKSRK